MSKIVRLTFDCIVDWTEEHRYDPSPLCSTQQHFLAAFDRIFAVPIH